MDKLKMIIITQLGLVLLGVFLVINKIDLVEVQNNLIIDQNKLILEISRAKLK